MIPLLLLEPATVWSYTSALGTSHNALLPASQGLLGKTSPSLGLQVTERQTLTEPLQQRSGNPGDEQPLSEVSP